MQQARSPKLVQLVADPFHAPVSGAEIRNDAIARALRSFAGLEVVSPSDFGDPGQRIRFQKSAPTLLLPEEACVQDFVKYIRRTSPDLLLIEGVCLLPFIEGVFGSRDFSRPKIVLDCHNVESALWWESNTDREEGWRSSLARLRYGRRHRRVVEADRRALEFSDRVLAVSRRDADRLATLAPHRPRPALVPNPVPSWALEEHVLPANAASRPVTNLLFVGHLSYPPNVEAVRFLMREIWPRLRSEFPDLRLTIAGRSPKRRLVGWARGDARTRLHADPEDLKPLYDRCDAVIVPLRSGGGSRIKVLEALACAKPVIASGKAVEGLDLEEGVHWLRAENPADYADVVRRLRSVPEVARELTTGGRRLVEERHTTAVIAENLKAVVDNLLRLHS